MHINYVQKTIKYKDSFKLYNIIILPWVLSFHIHWSTHLSKNVLQSSGSGYIAYMSFWLMLNISFCSMFILESSELCRNLAFFNYKYHIEKGNLSLLKTNCKTTYCQCNYVVTNFFLEKSCYLHTLYLPRKMMILYSIFGCKGRWKKEIKKNEKKW